MGKKKIAGLTKVCLDQKRGTERPQGMAGHGC